MKMKIKRISKSTLSVILAMMMLVSTMLVGLITVDASKGTDVNRTVYFKPYDFNNLESYVNTDGSIKTGYTLKVRFAHTQDNLINELQEMPLASKTIDGKIVYQATIYDKYDGLNNIYFRVFDSDSNCKAEVKAVNTWTSADKYSGKVYLSTGWKDPDWDTGSADQNYYILGPAVTNKADDWQSKIVTLETVSGTTHSHTFNSSSDIKENTDFLVSGTKSTDDNKKVTTSNGNGVTFSGSGESNVQFSLASGYTYPVTFTYDTNVNKLTGIATEKPVATTQDYRITGNITGMSQWKDYAGATPFTDNQITVTVTAGQQFRLMGENGKQYGWGGDNNYIVHSTGADNVILKQDNKVFQFDTAGTYTITLVNNSIPPVITISPKSSSKGYKLTGAIYNNKHWDDYSYGLTLNGPDANGVYSATYNHTSEENSRFRIISSDQSVYLPDVKGYNIISCKTENMAYGTLSRTYDNKDNYFNFNTNTEATYTIKLKEVDNGNPKIWVEEVPKDGITLAADSTELTFGEADTSVSTKLTVTATGSADISSVTYTVSSNGATVSNDVASVSSDGIFTATQAGEYTVTATAGAYSATVKIKVNAYKPGTLSGKYFFVSNNSDNPSGWNKSFWAYEDASGIYYVRLTVEDLKSIKNDFTGYYYFGISSSNSANKLYFGNNNTNRTDEYTVEKVDTNNLVEIGTQEWGGYYFAKFNISSQKVTAITLKFKDNTVSWNPDTKEPKSVYTVEVEDNYVPFPTDGIKVYAKNGTACNGGTCNFGKTTVTGLESQYIDDQGKYKIYAAKKGERLTISTKLNDNYLKANFYVHSFCINGSNYPAVKDTTDTTGATYRINVPYVMGSEQIEITPIYYNTAIENNDDYVAVYFDSTALDAHWGDTIAAYSYYDSDDGCMDGSYPGQPMIRVSDTLYMTYMSRYEYTLDDNGTLTKTTTPVMGFTASNYFEKDEVHNLFLTDAQKKNYQTYDYDDFKYIAKAGYDTVRFESKYCTGTTSNKTGHGTTLKDDLGTYTPESEYQDLVDFDGHKCSVLRYCTEEKNIPDDVNGGKLFEGENNYLRIISTGNNKDTNVGKWSTYWYVYAPDGYKITYGHPSDFVPRRDKDNNILPDDQQTAAYKAVKDYTINGISAAYFPAKISYEIEKMEDGGFRSDGLWLFSNSDSKVKVSTKIIYTDTEKSKVNDAVEWKDDPYKEGTITGTFTGADVSVDGVTSEDVYRNTEVQLSATNGNKYIFYGWAIKDSNGEYVMQNELSALSPYTVSVNTTLYAMYVQPDAGTLTLTNNRYTGAGAGIGTGSYYVSAVLYTKDGTLIKNYGRAEKSLIINDPENFNSTTPKDAYFKVTLHTDPFGDSQFVNFYVPSKEDGTLVPRDAETDTAYDYEFNIPVGVLYGADGKQTTQVINSYSNLKLPTVDLKFTHDLYSHAQKNSYDDPAGDGTGSTEIQITVINNSTADEIYKSQQTSRSITLLSSYLEQVISAIQAGAQLSDYTISVTLTTTPDPNTKFIKTYRKNYGELSETSPLNVSVDRESVWNVTLGTNQAVYSATLDEICTYADGTFKFKQNEINFYSDLDTVKIPYKINYNFTSRLYGEQTYAVNGKISMNSLNLLGDATNGYSLSEAFLTSSTPYETNHMKNLTWDYSNAQQSYTAEGGIVVNVNSTQTDIEVTATIKDGDKTYSVTTNYGEHFKLDGKFITASGDKFSYWEIRKVTDEFVCNNYSYQFNYVGYDDYIVTAVYDSSTSQADNINTTITDVNLSRNQWNVSGNSVTYPTADRIYVDFNLAYEYNGVKFNGDTLDKNVKLGYVIVAQRPDGNSVSADDLKNYIPSNTSNASFKVNGTNVINKAIDVGDLDNKNRVAATYGIKNTSANRNLTFTAYSYMIVDDVITLSGSPIEFTIDDIGTK